MGKLSREQLINKAANLAFPDSPGTAAKVIEAYKKDPEPEYTAEDDPETAELIEEMAVTDQVNCEDLKSYRDDLRKQSLQKLAKRHGEERRKRAQSAKEKKSKAAAKKKGKGKVNMKFAKATAKKGFKKPAKSEGSLAGQPPAADVGVGEGPLDLPAASGSGGVDLK